MCNSSLMKWKIASLGFGLFLSCTLSSEPFKEGRILYEVHCSNCHGLKFEGFEQLYPPLDPDRIKSLSRNEMVCLLVNGRNPEQKDDFKSAMPGFEKLSEVQICNILNYLGNHFGSDTQYHPMEVKAMITSCKDQK